MENTRVAERVVTCHDSTWTYLCAGEGPPVVWLHGLWGEPGWELHHQRLAEWYTVYAPVLPGYHGSSFPPWMVDVEDAATLVIDFLDTLKLERPIFIGHSLGGWIAAQAGHEKPCALRQRGSPGDPGPINVDLGPTPHERLARADTRRGYG